MDVAWGNVPVLLPEDEEGTVFHGYITAGGEEFRIRFSFGNEVDQREFACDPALARLLDGHDEAVAARLSRAGAPEDFHAELAYFLDRLDRTDGPAGPTSGTKPVAPTGGNSDPGIDVPYVEALLAEMDGLGWDPVLDVDPALTQLSVRAYDASGRAHVLSLTLPAGFPLKAPFLRADVPFDHQADWRPGITTLAGVVEAFETRLTDHLDLWEVMDEIDAQTWVLEPDPPSRATTTRRIALGQHASVALELSETNPRTMPGLRFLGADTVITPLRDHLNAHLDEWDAGLSVVTNLSRVLGIELPCPDADASREDLTNNCLICYSYKFNGAIPTRVCDTCRNGFHAGCLVSWLQNLASARHSFDTIFGSCPYCSAPINVRTTDV